ncbi:MAG TPA: 30S ribosomal protein S18 [Bacteroidetes bacterium]|jgi:small subunit ribosomal protein S18|nr:30S ribosomal protein S18 [Bacteroidota bacterium]
MNNGSALFPLQPESTDKTRQRVIRKRANPIRGQKQIDYLDVKFLQRYINSQGKILPARITGVSAYQQRRLQKAIKYARYLALIPYVGQDLS